MAAITGAAYIYGTTLVGPLEALRLIALGAASVAAVIVMFVRELAVGEGGVVLLTEGGFTRSRGGRGGDQNLLPTPRLRVSA
jgi:hypothetical protein